MSPFPSKLGQGIPRYIYGEGMEKDSRTGASYEVEYSGPKLEHFISRLRFWWNRDIPSVRPNNIPHGINGGRKWWNIPTEDCSTTNSFSSVIIGLFYFDDWLSDYSALEWNILTPQVEFCTFQTCA